MQLSFIVTVLALSAGVFAQIGMSSQISITDNLAVQDPVKMDAAGMSHFQIELTGLGNIIPATLVQRSQYRDFMKRQISDSFPTKTDQDGTESSCT